jgi:hypothetical protein
MSYTIIYRYFFTLISLPILISQASCTSNVSDTTLAKGEALARVQCSGCHLLPSPELLDKTTWREGVLPAMAEQFGIEVLQGNVYLPSKNSRLSGQDWQAIIHYYETLAPDTLIQNNTSTGPSKDPSLFRIIKPRPDNLQTASTLMVGIHPRTGKIYTSDLNNPGLYLWNDKLEPKRITALPSSAVDIYFGDDKDVITSMGGMRALDATKGDILTIQQNKNNPVVKNILGNNFIRPIQTRPIDYNKDGLMDYVVCSFGHNHGGLYILEQLPDKSFKKVPLREVPGATQAVTGDFNQDGWPDIMTLFAHGDEGIWIFLNDHKGGFKTENILRFPSVYGSSSFQLADIDHDKKLDIIYTAGDNSDYSRILKPYHGVYIYKNNGDLNGNNFQFEKVFFYPIHGATKVIAKDFDMDGDIDLATIAFFADLKNNPSEGFLYFEQIKAKNQPSFIRHATPVHHLGRWICMDAGDYDLDGDTDIVLGNFSKGFMNQDNFKPGWEMDRPFVILENNTIKRP